MAKKLISLKALLEEEEIKAKVDENDDEKVEESEDEDKVDESEDEDKVDESEDEEKVDEEDINSWAANWSGKKPGPLHKEALGEPDETASKLDTETKPGETTQTSHKLDDEKKPGETDQVKESEDEDKVDESEDEEKVDESDDDLLLLDESEDEEKVDESEDEEKVDESEDEDKVDESEDEEKVDEAVLDRMLKSLKIESDDVATFKDILRGAINESVNRTTRKAVKHARKLIVSEANDRIRLVSERKKTAIKEASKISARAFKRFEEAHAEELKKLEQFDEMVSLFKGMAGVMESFGLALAPANKKLKIQLEAARKAHAKEVAGLKKTNESQVETIEQMKIRGSLEKLSKTMTESERSEFISIVSEMKVTSHADFIKRATKVRDRLYKEEASEYNQFVERFTESNSLVDKTKVEKPAEKAPRNVMEAAHDVLRSR